MEVCIREKSLFTLCSICAEMNNKCAVSNWELVSTLLIVNIVLAYSTVPALWHIDASNDHLFHAVRLRLNANKNRTKCTNSKSHRLLHLNSWSLVCGKRYTSVFVVAHVHIAVVVGYVSAALEAFHLSRLQLAQVLSASVDAADLVSNHICFDVLLGLGL